MGNRVLDLEAKYADMNNRVTVPELPPPSASSWLPPTHEFISRTCKVGIKNGTRFKVVGFCCLIDEGVALTSDIVIQNVESLLRLVASPK